MHVYYTIDIHQCRYTLTLMCIQTVYMLWFKFSLGLNFVFLLFFNMVMYDLNEFETMEYKM